MSLIWNLEGSCSFFYQETIKGCLELEKVVEDNIYGIFYHFDGLRNFENFGTNRVIVEFVGWTFEG